MEVCVLNATLSCVQPQSTGQPGAGGKTEHLEKRTISVDIWTLMPKNLPCSLVHQSATLHIFKRASVFRTLFLNMNRQPRIA